MSFRVTALRLPFLAWWVLLSGFFANGQVSRVGATLEATVMDTSGAAVSGAQVTLRNTETNQSRTLVTDERGFSEALNWVAARTEYRWKNRVSRCTNTLEYACHSDRQSS